MSSAVAEAPARTAPRAPAQRRRGGGRVHVFLAAIALLWLFPILYAIYTSLQPYSDTADHGYVSIAHKLSFTNDKTAWENATCSPSR